LEISYFAIFGRSILDLGHEGPHAEREVRANIHIRKLFARVSRETARERRVTIAVIVIVLCIVFLVYYLK
jgi:hypothetical protein